VVYNADILLGTITKVYGHEGAVTVRLVNNFIENIPEMESVFLEIEGKPVPFIISESVYGGGNILRLKFEGYGTLERVTEFTGCRVFLTSTENLSGYEDTGNDITGFRVLLQDKSFLGTVTAQIDSPGQTLLNIKTETGKQILVPFHKDLIVRSDRKKGVIVMDLPEGLADLNDIPETSL